jgi:hypothetical protein
MASARNSGSSSSGAAGTATVRPQLDRARSVLGRDLPDPCGERSPRPDFLLVELLDQRLTLR